MTWFMVGNNLVGNNSVKTTQSGTTQSEMTVVNDPGYVGNNSVGNNLVGNDVCVVHLLSEGMPSQEDASTSWPSTSGLRGHRRTYLTVFKIVRYVLLQPLRPELDGQDVEASSREDTFLSFR
jgi:hypothetical protein